MFQKKDQNIPPHLAKRLIAIGEDPEGTLWILQSDGIEALDRFVNGLEERHALYREWSPRLFEFAEECRKVRPTLREECFTESDRVKLQIYERMITDCDRLQTEPNSVNICRVPLLGISVAERLWPGYEKNTVILTFEEKQRWDAIYQHAYRETFRWFIDYWWSVDDLIPVPASVVDKRHEHHTTSLGRLRRSFSEQVRRWNAPELVRRYLWAFGLIDDPVSRNIDLSREGVRARVQEGEKPILATTGLCWGKMAGGEKTNLWAQNGSECRYVDLVEVVDF
ncbi:MAG: hypothetical protein AB7O26_07400 [Planctomycetaceae bacterium]